MIDTSFLKLLPYLQQASVRTLWFADENALQVISELENIRQALHIATNRFDVYQLAQQKQFSCEFNDFTLQSSPYTLSSPPERVLYRISKEKPVTHHVLNQAMAQLNGEGELIVSGQKQEGIKGYSDKLLKIAGCKGKLQKSGNDYFGLYQTPTMPEPLLETQQYDKIRKLSIKHESELEFYSKPGVFGFNKIDKGTQLLLQSIPELLEEQKSSPKNILDLGCGYGWIFINLPHILPQTTLEDQQLSIVATDNNAAALLCAQKNAQQIALNVDVIPSNCADTINQTFDLILCNPPFHQGFSHDKSLTDKFLQQTYKKLSKTGLAVFVVNEFIKLSSNHLPKPLRISEKKRDNGFKIITLQHHS